MLINRCSNTIKILLALLAELGFASIAEANDELLFQTTVVPVVLSAAKLAQPLTEAPATVTVLDRALIEASGASQIAELFRLVPGMQVGYARGNFPVVSYQGLTSEFPQGVQVIIDGSSVYSPLFSGVIWSVIPIEIEDIERIEIVRGPNSASFGANSYQSVINITTTHPTQQPTLSVNVERSNEHQERGFLRFSGSHNKFDYRASVSTSKSEGYDDLSDNFSKQHFSSRVDYQLDQRNTLQLNLSLIDSTRQTESPIAALVLFDPKRDRSESSQFAQLKWDNQISTDEQLKTQLSFQHFDGKDNYAIPFFPNNLDISGDSIRWNADIEHLFKLNQTTRMVWGLGAVYETVFAPFRTNSRGTRSNQRYRLFSNIESRLSNQFILNTGALFEYDQISGEHYSPRVAINYLLSPENTFRISATRAFRTPVITEEYRSIFIGPIEIERSVGDLDAETVDALEVGYHGLFANNSWNADVRFFQNNYKKLINTELSGLSLTVVDNRDTAQTRGLEFELNYRSNKSTLFHAGYAYTDVTQATKQLNNSIPKHNFNALVSYRLSSSLQTTAAYYYLSEMQYLGPQNSPQSSFQRLDLSISKKYAFNSNKKLSIALKAELALDKNIDFHRQATADNRIMLQMQYEAQ